MVADDGAPAVAELVRRMNLVACDHDPVPQMVDVVVSMAQAGIALGDVVADSGYAHRVPERFALPLRAAGASLVMDLHPHDRGTRGTHKGAICCNGNLYCPATPPALFDLGPLARGASHDRVAAHDFALAELARFRFGTVARPDDDGYHRVACPDWARSAARCGRRRWPLPFTVPRSSNPPGPLPACCTQQTITVPPSVKAKTAQRHDYLSSAWRRSYDRRTAVERSNARVKDPATIDVARGWCRQMGLVPMSIWLCCALVIRNLAVADAFSERQADNERRMAAGLAPKTRRRRGRTLGDLVGASANAPP